MKQYNLSLVIEVPDTGASPEQVSEWAKFVTGYSGSISNSNPLLDVELAANSLEIEPH